jgi:hypothetical protein
LGYPRRRLIDGEEGLLTRAVLRLGLALDAIPFDGGEASLEEEVNFVAIGQLCGIFQRRNATGSSRISFHGIFEWETDLRTGSKMIEKLGSQLFAGLQAGLTYPCFPLANAEILKPIDVSDKIQE